MSRYISLLLAAVVLVADVAAGPARAAEPTEADQHSLRAIELYRADKLEEAIAAWQRAHALDGRVAHVCNIGRAYSRLDRWAEAHVYLTRCVEGDDKQLARRARSALADATRRCERGDYGRLNVEARPAGARARFRTFLPTESFALPVTLWLPTGPERLEVAREGHAPRLFEVDVVESVAKLTVVLEPGDFDPDAAPDWERDPDPPQAAAGLAPTAPTRSDPRLPGYITVGAGGAFVLGGFIAHMVAVGTRAEAEEKPAGAEFNGLRSTFRTQRGVAIGFYAVGAATLGVGVYLLVRAIDEDAAAALTPTRVGTGGALSLRF